MIRFLLKGLLRDRSRSRFPAIVVFIGVLLSVFLYAWVRGVEVDLVRSGANFGGGHVKVTTRAYAQEADQLPNDLALLGVSDLLAELRRDYPAMVWTPRTRFGGLLDIPDEQGETRVQSPVAGLAVDLLGKSSPEPGILNLKPALVQGRLPSGPGEILVSDDLARRLKTGPGDVATLFASDIYGSLASANFRIAGTVRFGVGAMDRGALIADIADIQSLLDLPDASGEVLGFSRDFAYNDAQASRVAAAFNAKHPANKPQVSDSGTDRGSSGSHFAVRTSQLPKTQYDFTPEMVTLRNQAGLGQMFDLVGSSMGLVMGIFLIAMSIVLWNAGLMGSLRRWGEFGLRLAIGEGQGHVYRTLLLEALMVGMVGSVAGTAAGLGIAFWFEKVGLNVASLMQNSSMMMSGVMRARVAAPCFYIGFIPGLFATIAGAAISGLTVFRRDTAKLVKELQE
jgi:putative ABC transport system permease protein